MNRLLFFIFVSASAHATSFYVRPFSEFIQTSPNIVRGTLSNIHAENAITPDGGKTIYTYATVEVKEVLKGSINTNKITVRRTGGSKDGVTLEIPSSPEFEEGEDSVLFLSEVREDRNYEVDGMELGKFGLSEQNGQEVLTGGIFNYSRPDASGDQDHDHDLRAADLRENLKPWSLAMLRERIKEQGSGPESIKPTAAKITRYVKNLPTPDPSTSPQEDHLAQANEPEKPLNSKPIENSFPWTALFLLLALTGSVFFFRRRR